jgi:hypothetical protein
LGAPNDPQRSDHPGLGREQQRSARVADGEGLDVVRDHALKVVGGIGAQDAQERAAKARNSR